MKLYEVYFEIGGKKMKSSVFAESEREAKEKIKDKIKFHKTVIKAIDDNVGEVMELFNDLFKK